MVPLAILEWFGNENPHDFYKEVFTINLFSRRQRELVKKAPWY